MRDVLRRAGELSARTMIFDIEPLVAYWDGGQEALDQGIARVLSEVAVLSAVQVVCFATNSSRRPSVVPGRADVQVVYLASVGKPLRTAAYQRFPQPGVGPATVYLQTMFVRPGVRGSGVGAALVRHVHGVLDARGVQTTLLHYALMNPLSAPFWNRMGYRPLGTGWEVRPAASLR